MTIKTLALGALTLAALAAAPGQARLVKLDVAGTITAGTDGGNELVDVTNGSGGYVEHFGPSTVFGTAGSLIGKKLVFSMIYDSNSPDIPVGAGGVFDDGFGQWTYDAVPTLTIGGVKVDLIYTPMIVYQLLALTDTLAIVDGTADAFSGSLTGFTLNGGVYSNYASGSLDFSGLLPASFFSTDALLPGQLPGPGYGFAHHSAVGTGSFDLTRQTCFLTCSFKQASGTFALTAISFGAVPEPAAWTLMIAGFAFVGIAARRRAPAPVVAA